MKANPLQVWLLFVAFALAWLWAAGIPAHELRPVAWIGSAVCAAGGLCDVVDLFVRGGEQ